MSFSPTRPDLRLDADERLLPPCECTHDDGRSRCRQRARHRVTVVCVAPGCDCAAGVYLLCAECLESWQEHARSDGVRLRVRWL